MSRNYVYSFEDTTVELVHPGYGRYPAYGTGIGTITISYSSEISEQDVAADLTVIISKHPYNHGKISFDVLQSSDFNSWLKKFTSWLKTAPTDQWALTTISIKNKSTGDSYFLSGVSIEKIPDQSYASKAANRTWSFLVANISNN